MTARSALYDDALEKASRHEYDYVEVLNLLRSARREGDARAAYALATWYINGRHVRKNFKKAVVLLHEAAEANIPDALYDLAISYEKGRGVKRDKAQAFKLYVKAALNGDAQSHYEVARCYAWGIGVNRDSDLAYIWRDKAIELGCKIDLPR